MLRISLPLLSASITSGFVLGVNTVMASVGLRDAEAVESFIEKYGIAGLCGIIVGWVVWRTINAFVKNYSTLIAQHQTLQRDYHEAAIAFAKTVETHTALTREFTKYVEEGRVMRDREIQLLSETERTLRECKACRD